MSVRVGPRLRRLCGELSDAWPGCRAEVEYDASRRGWEILWIDGPATSTVRERATTLVAAEHLRLVRSYSPRAYAIAAVQACLDGAIAWDRRPMVEPLLEDRLAEVEAPAAAQGRTAALAEALLAHVAEDYPRPDTLAAPIQREGLSWLLGQPSVDAPEELVMSPLEVLTDRYLLLEDRRAWTWRLHTPVPAPELVRTALADADLDREGYLAVCALLRELRAEVQRLEDQALSRAHDSGASWADIGRAMGITKQAAAQRAQARAAGAPTRL